MDRYRIYLPHDEHKCIDVWATDAEEAWRIAGSPVYCEIKSMSDKGWQTVCTLFIERRKKRRIEEKNETNNGAKSTSVRNV